MHALVTGGSGFLGTALLRALAVRGTRLRVLLRPSSDTTALDALDAQAGTPVERVVTGGADMDPGALQAALEGVDVVFHLASALSGGAEAVMRGTLGSSSALLDALAGLPRPPRVVLVSSIAVHDTAGLDAGAVVDDDTPLEPRPALRDAYTDAKLHQERMFRDRCARHGIPLAVARPGVIYGRGRMAPSARVGLGPFAGCFLLLGGDNPLPLVHVDHCAAALVHIASHAAFHGEAFNIVDAAPPPCRDYLRRYRDRMPSRMRIIPVPAVLARLAAQVLPALHARSRGRVPLLLTPYRWRSSWRPFRYGTTALSGLGFVQARDSATALSAAFDAAAE